MMNKKIKPKIHEEIRYKILPRYITKKDCSLLDVGARDGILSQYIDRSIRYFGIDIFPKTELVTKCDITKDNFPFESDSFDYVVITEVLEHLQDHSHCLSECYRVLKKEGILIGTVPNCLRIANVLRSLFNRPVAPPSHLVTFSVKEIGYLLNINRFKTIDIHPVCFRLSSKMIKNIRILEKIFPQFCEYIFFYSKKVM